MKIIQSQREGQWGPEEYNNDALRMPIAGHLNKTKEGYGRDYVTHIPFKHRELKKSSLVIKYLWCFPIICLIKSRLSDLADKIFHHIVFPSFLPPYYPPPKFFFPEVILSFLLLLKTLISPHSFIYCSLCLGLCFFFSLFKIQLNLLLLWRFL